jgi:hypothetical protein
MNMYFGAIWGQAAYVESYYKNQIYLNHQLLETKKISLGEATSRAQEFLAMMSGVRNVYTSLQLMTDNNEHLRKMRNGFNAEHCGDIVIETAPGWKLLNEDTQETQVSRASFVPFPIFFYGAGIASQRVNTPVTTDRIAPTIARAIRIRAPNACSSAPLFYAKAWFLCKKSLPLHPILHIRNKTTLNNNEFYKYSESIVR